MSILPTNQHRTLARLLGFAMAALALALLQACTQAPTGPARLDSVVLSASEDGPAQTEFAPDTAAIFLRAGLVDARDDTVVRAAWIAEDTGGAAPANFEIDSTELRTGSSMMNQLDFSMNRPDAGWPVGKYRVDLSVDGKPAQSVAFTVAG